MFYRKKTVAGLSTRGLNTHNKNPLYGGVRMIFRKKFIFGALILLSTALLFSSCQRRLGWGVLLWSTESPYIVSGTVLPVYMRSNINRVWVVGVPQEFRNGGPARIEVPFAHLEMVGARRSNAIAFAENFSTYALVYAENLHPGLPIRNAPNNSATTVYRMLVGEIIKVLDRAEGIMPIGATGQPLPGEWFRVLAIDGTVGYSFSNRLRLFENHGGSLDDSFFADTFQDPALDAVMATVWSPELYAQMISTSRVDINQLENRWGFDPGRDTGIARISLPGLDLSFSYARILPDGENAWIFDGTSLSMSLRTSTNLTVQFTESTGDMRTLQFVALPARIDDLIAQERNRRASSFAQIYNHGPVFTSGNYGTIALSPSGEFSWTGFDRLVPSLIPPEAAETGRVEKDLFLTPFFENLYSGAFTFHFQNGSGAEIPVRFMYTLDEYGLRLEAVPDFALDNVTVSRRAAAPVVMFFFMDQAS